MSQLEWSDALSLDLPEMDDTHREFVDLLARVVAAEEAQVLTRWSDLVDHTDEHFSLEDQWMHKTGFASANCHSMQHKVVLQVMREGLKRGQGGDLPLVRQMANELGAWFPQHAQSMDAALALHLRRAGFDPVSGQVSMPDALPREMIHGCGAAACSDHSEPQARASATAA